MSLEIQQAEEEIRKTVTDRKDSGKHYLFDSLPEEMADLMEQVRLGKKTIK